MSRFAAAKSPPHTGCCAFTTWQCLCPFRLSRSKQCSIALRNMTQSDDASAIAYGEHRILELRAIRHSAEIVLCTTLRNPLNCVPNVMDYRAFGYSVGSPAGLMLERCNEAFEMPTSRPPRPGTQLKRLTTAGYFAGRGRTQN